jgi:hypothetical protein
MAATLVTVAGYPSILDFDPGAKLVREAKAIGLPERLKIIDRVWRRSVVVRDADVERHAHWGRHRL